MPFKALTIALALTLPLLGQSRDKEVRVFLFAGQSNMVGSHSDAKDVDRYPPFAGAAAPNAKVRYFYVLGREDKKRSSGFVPLQPVDGVLGPEITFARRLEEAGVGPIAIVKVAAGGTTLGSDWNPDQPAGFQLYPLALEALREATGELTKKRIPWRLEGVCWHQGENDMFEEAYRAQYAANLKNFIAAWRRDTGVKDLTFYLGELCTKTVWGMDNRNPMEAIALAQIAVADEDPQVEYVETAHVGVKIGEENGLHYHYGTLGQLEHGVNYAERYLARTKGWKRPARPLKTWPYKKEAPLDLYVLAGHRNMEGERAFVQHLKATETTKSLAKDDPKIAFAYALGGLIHQSDGFEPLGPAGLYDTFGPELSFAKALRKKAAPPFAIAKFTHSGSQIVDWTKEGSSAPRRNLYPKFLDFTREQIRALEAKGHPVRLRAIVYHLGENDLSFHPHRRQASAWLGQLIADTRKDLNLPELPWILSQGPAFPSEAQAASEVFAQLARLAAEDPHLRLVNALDPPAQAMALVFDARATVWLGERLAAAIE